MRLLPVQNKRSQAVLSEVPELPGRRLQGRLIPARSGQGLCRAFEVENGDERTLTLLGVDISKWTVLSAARQQRDAT